MYKVLINDKTYNYEENKTLESIATELGIKCLAAKVNNRIRELGYYINYDCKVEFIGFDNFDATRVYDTSLRYLVIMALERIDPSIKVFFSQGVSRSIACHIEGREVDEEFLSVLEAKLKEIVKANYKINRHRISKEEALELYKEKGYTDKVDALKYRPNDYVNTYECDGYINYMFGYMVPSTGYVSEWKFICYEGDFLIQYPRADLGGKIPEFEDAPVFTRMIKDAKEWAIRCDGDTIAKMNKHLDDQTMADFVNMCETRHNDMLADLGLRIKSNPELRLICIAGPSSSGKTTFSHRLRIELMARGIKTFKISMDDYYKNKGEAPLDEDGKPDLEHVDALDVPLFNKHLLELIQGKEVASPIFDFTIGARSEKVNKIKVPKDAIIIIEGIHALNERLTKSILKHQKFKIYISPLTQINIDNHNPINATDVRLLRRIVRDAQFRKTDPVETLAMWPSVRRGEFKWIYPNQESADYIYNTELTYELCVMKKYALPALSAVDRNNEYYIQANRFVKFLKYFKDIDDRYVPCNSLLREFIGGSCFYDED